MGFTEDDRRLLDGPAVAVLTTLFASGEPHSTVMWFRFADDVVRMIAPASALKARHIANDPRVSVVVTDPENPYAYVTVRGQASLVRDDAAARAELRRIAARYIGERADGYVDSLSAEPRVLIEIHATRVSGRHRHPPA